MDFSPRVNVASLWIMDVRVSWNLLSFNKWYNTVLPPPMGPHSSNQSFRQRYYSREFILHGQFNLLSSRQTVYHAEIFAVEGKKLILYRYLWWGLPWLRRYFGVVVTFVFLGNYGKPHKWKTRFRSELVKLFCFALFCGFALIFFQINFLGWSLDHPK